MGRKGERIAKGVHAADANVFNCWSHTDVVEAFVIDGGLAVAQDHVADNGALFKVVDRRRTGVGQLRPGMARGAFALTAKDGGAAHFLGGQGIVITARQVTINRRIIGDQRALVKLQG